MNPTFIRPFAALLFVSSSLLVAPAAEAKDLWTHAKTTHDVITIPSVSPLVKVVEPASLVVLVTGSVKMGALPDGHPPMPGGMRPGPQDVTGQGSGFLIAPTGYALTNNHVVEGATSVRVLVGKDPKEYLAQVVGTDEKSDVALIKIKSERTDWPVIPLGDSTALQVGDFVVAIGNPFGLTQTVSLGILSARHRKDIAPSGKVGLYDFLQTDASINPGNSGGPLLNLRGEVIGMNTAINAAASGIGFAIPINMVKAILPALKEKGHVVRSWIGVGISPVDRRMAKGLGLDRARGALVRSLAPNGPAKAAGLLPGDVIVGFDNAKIENASDLPLLAASAGVGTSVVLKLVRDGQEKTLKMTLGELPSAPSPHPKQAKSSSEQESKPNAKKRTLGLKVTTLSRSDRGRLSLADEVKGTLVVSVKMGSPAFNAGLQPDDVILSVNHSGTKSAKAFAKQARSVSSGSLMRLLVQRGESTLFIPLMKP